LRLPGGAGKNHEMPGRAGGRWNHRRPRRAARLPPYALPRPPGPSCPSRRPYRPRRV